MLIIIALAVVMCGRLMNAHGSVIGSQFGSTSVLPKRPSAQIWKNSPKYPHVIGVAPLVPPKDGVHREPLVVKMRSKKWVKSGLTRPSDAGPMLARPSSESRGSHLSSVLKRVSKWKTPPTEGTFFAQACAPDSRGSTSHWL